MIRFKRLLRTAFPLIFQMIIVPSPSKAQSMDFMGSVLVLTGASSEEELDEQEVERFQRYLSHPLELNLSGRSRLVSSGLLSRYQIASLEDYRSRYGDVLSFAELAAVEGFGEEYVRALRPFVSLSSGSLPGQPVEDTLRLRNEVLLRAAAKGSGFTHRGNTGWGWGRSPSFHSPPGVTSGIEDSFLHRPGPATSLSSGGAVSASWFWATISFGSVKGCPSGAVCPCRASRRRPPSQGARRVSPVPGHGRGQEATGEWPRTYRPGGSA